MRVWREEVGVNQFEWRAHIRDVPGGEVCYIRSWQGLVKFLDTLEETEQTE